MVAFIWAIVVCLLTNIDLCFSLNLNYFEPGSGDELEAAGERGPLLGGGGGGGT